MSSGSANIITEAKYKIKVIALIIIITVLAFSIHLFNLQIVRGMEFETRARQVSSRHIVIPSQRGEIFDRNYDVPLVMNIPSFAVDIIPAEIGPELFPEIVRKLAEVLEVDEKSIYSRLPANYLNQYQPIEVKSGVSFETITYIAERQDSFPGVTWHDKPIRNYLETGSIAHVLGYVGNITTEELQVLYNEGYDFNAVLGKSGVEKEYDRVLRGTDGRRFRIVDVKGRKIAEGGLEAIPPSNGNNIVLTLDRNIQKLCEKALGNRMGSIIVLKPATGEILAMVSYPSFDPNIFYTKRESEEIRRLSLDPRAPFLNRAIRSSYAPASAFKVVMTTAILEEEIIPPDQKITCDGKITVGNRVFNCHKKTGHGPLDLAGALAQSCDVYYWTVGARLGVEKIIDYAQRYGFGELTGIDIPGETKGLVPSPQWKEQTFRSRWVGGDTLNISIGQGFLDTTPLQMANMVAMVVNGGVIYRPHLLKEIRDPVTGEILERRDPEVLRTSNIKKDTFETVREHMRGVITEGTARVVITTKATKVAGKTGTGEVGLDDRWTSWFAAYAPFEAPPEEQIVVVTMIEATNEWEWWAPKAANIIFQGIFANQNYEEVISSLRWDYMVRPQGRME